MDLILGVCFNEIYGESIMHPNDLEPIKLPFVLEPQYFLIEADSLIQITNPKDCMIKCNHGHTLINTSGRSLAVCGSLVASDGAAISRPC